MNDSAPATTLEKMDVWCAARRKLLLSCILALAVLLRVVVYSELRGTPVFSAHKIPEMDMSFFDKWAVNIAEKDFWSRKEPLHPIHLWHHQVGAHHFRTHPDQLSAVHAGKTFDDLDDSEKTIENWKLWVGWYKGHRFHQEPLYPYLLAAIYSIVGGTVVGGSDVGTIFILQMLIGVVTIGLMFGATRRLFNDLAAVLAGFMMVFWAPLIHFETVLLRTTLIVFFGAALLYCAQRLIEPAGENSRRPAWRWLVFGCAIGLATALKTTFFAVGAGLLVGVLWGVRRERARCVRAVGFTAVGALVCLLPFFVRNVIADAPTFSLTSVGPVTFAGSNLPSNDPWLGWYPFHDAAKPLAQVMFQSQGETLATVSATLGLYDSLFDLAGLWWRKFLVVWQWFEIPNNVNYYFHNQHSSVRAAMRYMVAVWWIVPLALVGLIAAWRRRGSGLWIWIWYLVCSIGPMIVFYVLSRFRAPLIVGMVPFAAFGILKIVEWLLRRAWAAVVAVAVVLVALAIWMNREPPVPVVRSDQYGTAYKFHYLPQLDEAAKENDRERIVAIFDQLIDTAPSYMKHVGPTRRLRTLTEVKTARFFANTYEMQARYVAPTDAKRARYYKDLATRIRSVLPAPIKK